MWVPFNEGWGQFDTDAHRRTDQGSSIPRGWSTAPGGWTDRGSATSTTCTSIPGPACRRRKARASVLGEFGGLGLPVEGHTWLEKGNWGYRSFTTSGRLGEAYVDLMRQMRPLVWQGLSAAIYTQTTDVEIEVNGLMTYDRAVEKWPAAALASTKQLYEKPGRVVALLPTSQERRLNGHGLLKNRPRSGQSRLSTLHSGTKDPRDLESGQRPVRSCAPRGKRQTSGFGGNSNCRE